MQKGRNYTVANESEYQERLKYIPKSLVDAYAKSRDFYNRPNDNVPFYERQTKREMQLMTEMHRAGVPFLAGTDTGQMWNVLPGFSMHEELALLVEAGLTPMEALQSATRNPGQYLSEEGKPSHGTVEEGKFADLLLLDANPLADIHNTRKISAVVIRGKVINSAERQVLMQRIKEVAKKK